MCFKGWVKWCVGACNVEISEWISETGSTIYVFCVLGTIS